MSVDRIGSTSLAHVHIYVDDLDLAAGFYRDVLDFVEMQSHHDLVNRGLAAYYGIDDPDSFVVSLRFMAWPGRLTLKLIQAKEGPYKLEPHNRPRSTYPYQGGNGNGTLSIEVKDLDATYTRLSEYARDYSADYKIRLLSPPVTLSPLLPHQIGATKTSALYGRQEILDELARNFANRRKFQLIDPFGMHWEFNNSTL